MKLLNLLEVSEYIKNHIDSDFRLKRTKKLEELTLDDVLKRKNPYLYKAKGSNSAHDYIKSILDATVVSGEEGGFGNFLEQIAIFVCDMVYGGKKSSAPGIDLEFETSEKKYLITIKSGPNWGNSGQIRDMLKKFNDAKRILTTSKGVSGKEIIFIEGCCYGVDNVPNKITHFKFCGQLFWELISCGNESLYKDIIEPLGYLAKEWKEEIEKLYSKKLNIFTAAFVERFCDDGIINWERLLSFNSGKSD
jgi:hypothetical protein